MPNIPEDREEFPTDGGDQYLIGEEAPVPERENPDGEPEREDPRDDRAREGFEVRARILDPSRYVL